MRQIKIYSTGTEKINIGKVIEKIMPHGSKYSPTKNEKQKMWGKIKLL